MSDFGVTLADFEPVEGDETGWVVRVVLNGTGLTARSVRLVAQVGDVPVEGLAPLDTMAIGFLSTMPPVGAAVSVGYEGEGMLETSFTFPGFPNA